MYSGLLITRHSGNWLGAHQKFNKIAYRLVLPEIDMKTFPSIDGILHFEGYNGPDGLKKKSAGHHEPSHFYDPLEGRGAVLAEIRNHYVLLVDALKKQDKVRSAFEASWLAHAITDGLTPAHHYPFEEAVKQLRQGAKSDVREFRQKMIVSGPTRRQTIAKTWKLMGAKGLLSTHLHFELGVAASVATGRFNSQLNLSLLENAAREGPVRFFKDQARMIAGLSLYEKFYRTGWTVKLARLIRKVLTPAITETIAVVWLLAYQEAGYKLRNS